MTEVLEEWISRSEEDYVSVLELARRKRYRVRNVICNECQQRAEKYLKTLLVRQSVSFPKTHDMKQLYDLVLMNEADI